MTLGMPILSEYRDGEGLEQLVDQRDYIFSPGNREGSSSAEVVLKIDDEEGSPPIVFKKRTCSGHRPTILLGLDFGKRDRDRKRARPDST